MYLTKHGLSHDASISSPATRTSTATITAPYKSTRCGTTKSKTSTEAGSTSKTRTTTSRGHGKCTSGMTFIVGAGSTPGQENVSNTV